MKVQKLAPYLILVILALAFFIGSNWQKIIDLQKSSPSPTSGSGVPAGPKLNTDDLKMDAKVLGLDTNKFNSCLDTGQYKDKVNIDIAYGNELRIDSTPTFYLNGHFLSGALSYQTFKTAIDFELEGGDWTKIPSSIANDVDSEKADIDISDGQRKGNNYAKVVLVEFGDFQCPYCADFWQNAEQQLIKDYVNTGKVLLVYKNFPLFTIHPLAFEAAGAGECAAEQGKFWEMHDLIYKSHQS